jgi:hypothetical protein
MRCDAPSSAWLFTNYNLLIKNANFHTYFISVNMRILNNFFKKKKIIDMRRQRQPD